MLHSIFAMELCVRLLPGAQLRPALQHFVLSHPERAGHNDRHALYHQITDALLSNLNMAERGCWDYFADDEKAQADFKMWCDGMLTEEGVRPGPSGAPDPYRPEPRYLTFTMAMLLVQNSPADMAIRRLCSIPENVLWNRSSFARILQGLRVVSFASVVSDVLYLIPGDDAWGLTLQDLAEPKFEYLRPIANA